MIYLVSHHGHATTNDRQMADALIAVGGYEECTKEDYEAVQRLAAWIDKAVAEAERRAAQEGDGEA